MNDWWLMPAPTNDDLRGRHPGDLGQLPRGVLHGVAEPDDLRGRRALVGDPAEHRHRVGVVEEPGARAHLGHVAADAEHHGRRPQRAEDAADAERVADRLAQAVAERHLVVADGGGVAADLHRVDHVVARPRARRAGRATPSRADAGRGPRRPGARAPRPSRAARHRCRAARSRVAEFGEGEDVADEVARELDAAGADEGDLGHACSLRGPGHRERRHPAGRTATSSCRCRRGCS